MAEHTRLGGSTLARLYEGVLSYFPHISPTFSPNYPWAGSLWSSFRRDRSLLNHVVMSNNILNSRV
jgi:hypothetical protein